MDKLETLLSEFLTELKEILGEVRKEASPEVPKEKFVPQYDGPAFFNSIRKSLFGRLTPAQVEGTEAKINAFIEAGWPISWAAYALATSYHETAARMMPVREGLNASEAWRKRTLRYYPWYGRGDVQLTWESNYKKADEELGLGGRLINNLDLALDKDISARILVRGMAEGWFSGDKLGRHTLQRHLPSTTEATFEQFKQARRIINLMDKAELIANHALKFQTALKEAKYP